MAWMVCWYRSVPEPVETMPGCRPGMFAGALADLFARAERGELKAIVGATYPLEQAPQAQIDLRARRTTGKLLLDPTL